METPVRLRRKPAEPAGPDPGWYDDPLGAAGWLRYWDGTTWTDSTTPDPAAAPHSSAAPRRAALVHPSYTPAASGGPRRAANLVTAPATPESAGPDSIDALFGEPAPAEQPLLAGTAGQALLAAAGHLTSAPPREKSRRYPVSPRNFVLVTLTAALVAAAGLLLTNSGLIPAHHRAATPTPVSSTVPTSSPTSGVTATPTPLVDGQPVTVTASDCRTQPIAAVPASGVQLSDIATTGTYQSDAGWQVLVPAGWVARSATAASTGAGQLAVFSSSAEPGVGMSLTVTAAAADAPVAPAAQLAGCQLLTYLALNRIDAQPLPKPSDGYWLAARHGARAAVAYTLRTTVGDASVLEIGPTTQLKRRGATAPALAVLGSLADAS